MAIEEDINEGDQIEVNDENPTYDDLYMHLKSDIKI